MIKQCFVPQKSPDEFVSYNARRISEPSNSSYEMLESKTQHTASTADLSLLKPEPSIVRTDLTSSLREYNPSTFSAHMRGRPMPIISTPSAVPYPTYLDIESGNSRSPPPPPFSPFHDLPNYDNSPDSRNPPSFSPYTDNTPNRTPVSGGPKFPEGARLDFGK